MKFAIGLLVALVVVGCSGGDSQIVEGKVIYEQYCGSCHGMNGEGQADWQYPDDRGILPAPPHNDSGHTWHHPDDQLLTIIANGRNAMPPFQATLTTAQQKAVLAYIKTFWSPELREAQESVTRQSESK